MMNATGLTTKPPQVESIVSSSTLKQEIDIDKLAGDLSWDVSNPDDYSGIVCNPEDAETTVMIFRTGEITIAGATSKVEVDETVESFFDELESLGVSTPSPPPVEYQNVVCTAEINHELNLRAAAIGLGLTQVEYEPEQFNGLVYRPEEYTVDVTFLIFTSGSMVITGTTDYTDAKEVFHTVVDDLIDMGVVVE